MTSPLINVMSAAAIKAGKGLVRDFGEVDQLQISRKGTSNFVTSSDLRTEKLLQKELSKVRPDYAFLLEEGGEVGDPNAEYRWVIDPLDGTSNFIHAVPYFCISIGLEKRFRDGKSEVQAGVIFDPIHNELFSAEKHKGAFLNGRRLAVSNRNTLDDCMLVTGNPRLSLKGDQEAFKLFDSIGQSGATIRFFGASALDLAYLAAGRIDACWYYMLKPWDMAAGLLLVQEAGGVTTDLTGAPATLYSNSLLASNTGLSDHLRRLLLKAA